MPGNRAPAPSDQGQASRLLSGQGSRLQGGRTGSGERSGDIPHGRAEARQMRQERLHFTRCMGARKEAHLSQAMAAQGLQSSPGDLLARRVRTAGKCGQVTPLPCASVSPSSKTTHLPPQRMTAGNGSWQRWWCEIAIHTLQRRSTRPHEFLVLLFSLERIVKIWASGNWLDWLHL